MEKQQPSSYAKNTVVKNNRNNYTEVDGGGEQYPQTLQCFPMIQPFLLVLYHPLEGDMAGPANEQHAYFRAKVWLQTRQLLFARAPEGFCLKLQPWEFLYMCRDADITDSQ